MPNKVVSLCVLLCVVATVTGCRWFGKKKTESTWTGAEVGSLTVNEPTYQAEPYTYTPPPAAVEADYGDSVPPAPSGDRYHTVVKGDTLYALARSYYGDQRKWRDIYEANRSTVSDPNKIHVGQRLLIP